jgi:hypothetical protein
VCIRRPLAGAALSTLQLLLLPPLLPPPLLLLLLLAVTALAAGQAFLSRSRQVAVAIEHGALRL